MIFHSRANKTHFHQKGCALGLILKVRLFGTQKWPTALLAKSVCKTVPNRHKHKQKVCVVKAVKPLLSGH